MLENTVILMIEENEEHVELIRESLLLTCRGLDIIHFKDPMDTLDFLFRATAEAGLEDRKKYIVLLNISAGGANGMEILKKIKQDVRTKKIPVIILTEADDPEMVEQCYHLGCSTYIVKPAGRPDFEETLQSVGRFLSIVETAFI